jgi:leucyl-tRNA synthetase
LTFRILLICSQIETDKEDAEQLALAAPKVQSYLEGRQIRKVIVVPERLVNIACG